MHALTVLGILGHASASERTTTGGGGYSVSRELLIYKLTKPMPFFKDERIHRVGQKKNYS